MIWIFQILGIKELYDREPGAYDELMACNLEARSFCPVVSLRTFYLAIVLIFAGFLNIKEKVLARPQVGGYDYFRLKPIEFSLK
ncbi:MAG: hypothetical protein ACFFAN_18110 [Promethearchaeota archaeon]